MPPSADEPPPGRTLAVAAEGLFLANLLLAPGVAFLALAWLWLAHRRNAPRLARCHLAQAFFVSLWGGLVLIAACGAILGLGGLGRAGTWVAVILYFTCVHSTLVLCGMFGLARAMAGREFVYPLMGVRYD